MKLSKVTKFVVYICAFLIFAIIAGSLEAKWYESTHNINPNILFDGFEELPIVIAASLVGGVLGVLVVKLIFLKTRPK